MKKLMTLMVFLMASSCAVPSPPVSQQPVDLQAVLLAKYGPHLASDRQLREDIDQFKKEDEAWRTQRDAFDQKSSSFFASFSDKELRAYTDLGKAWNDLDKAWSKGNYSRYYAADMKFERLLNKSGKMDTFLALREEGLKLAAQSLVLEKKSGELQKRIEETRHFWADEIRKAKEDYERTRDMALIDALKNQNINLTIWDLR